MGLDTSKIIHAPIGGGKYTVTSPLTKSDYGIMLVIENAELPTSYQVDFSNNEHSGTSLTRIGGADGVEIPKQYIDTGKDVFAWLYWVGEDYGKTVYKFRIPNKCRPDRTDEQPTPTQQSIIDQAISALNSAVEQTAQDVIDADASAQSASQSADRAEEAKTDAQNYATQAEQSATDAQTSASQASASATASAQSAQNAETARQETTSLVAEAQRCADASAQSVQTAHTYASSANMASDMASDSADLASGYASSAQTSAQTASSKASEASTSASTASTKALESAQSASQALTYKTDAESAKTASQTAQGLAESARDSAISAKNDAEDARDEAQNLVDGISGKVEQIDSNTERIESLEDDRYKPYAVDTASGAVASFSDGADDIPLKSLVVNIDPVQDTSSGDPSPTNICPISGWTGANVWHGGKNLLALPVIRFSEGTATVGNCFYLKQGTYTLSYSCADTHRFGVRMMDANGTIYTDYSDTPISGFTYNSSAKCYYAGANIASGNKAYTMTIKHGCYVRIVSNLTGGGFTNVQLEQGSSATAHGPYQGQTIPISWQTEAGTVYGGKLDVLSGVMTILNKHKTITDANVFGNYGATGFTFNPTDMKSGMAQNGLCNLAPTVPRVSSYGVLFGSNNSVIYFAQAKSVWGVTTTDDAKQWAIDHGLELVYPLATPIEIQLTPHEVRSLLGQNNIFADTGDTTCEYRADTKLYIERLTAPDSDDMIADANITSGQYFMVGNSLYKATANIANGGQIIVGTNATRVSLAQALNEINA